MTRPFTGIRNVIFDFDGTLIDGYRPVTESVNAALAGFGRPPVSPEIVRPLCGQGLELLLANFFSPPDITRAVQLFRQHYAKVYLDGNFLLDGTFDILTRLHNAGLRLAVASNKPGDRVRGICDHLRISPFLAVMIGAGDVENLKPHPQMVLLVLERLRATPADTLYVGDTSIDVQTARAAGLRVVCLLGGSASQEQLLAAHPDLIIPSLNHLPEVIGIA